MDEAEKERQIRGRSPFFVAQEGGSRSPYEDRHIPYRRHPAGVPPPLSLDLIRQVLKTLRKEKRVECLGRGQNAEWRRTGRGEGEIGTTQSNGY